MSTTIRSRRHRRRTSLLLSALVCVVLGTGAVASQAHATPQDNSPTAPTMIVLDASGSMLADDAPGVRMEAAKRAVSNLVTGLPDGAELGLMVYGTGTGSSDAEMATGCHDIQTLIPVGPVDSSAFVETVQGIRASGYTPIGSALRAAADALPASEQRSIVLVSDGIDTCAPPSPCDIAAELAAEGLDVVIHTVGFRVDEHARAELECIAQATSGSYRDAADADELDNALRVQVDHAITGYTAEGQPVSGAGEPTPDAPLLTPGQYIDILDTSNMLASEPEAPKYYRLEVPSGWTAQISGTMSVPIGASEKTEGYFFNLDLDLYEADSSHCASAWGLSAPNTDAGVSTRVLQSTGCSAPTYLRVVRDGNKYLDVPATLELLVRYEPPADASGLPTPQVMEAAATPEHSDVVTPVTGGLSFNRATVLAAGQTYESTVVSGETRYFKIPVTWGQQIAYAVTFTGTDSIDQKWNQASVEVDNPLREEISFLGSGGTWSDQMGNPDFGNGSVEKVRYGSEQLGYDGDYYLRVTAADPKGEPYELRFLLTATTPGEIEPGPVYDYSAVESPTPTPTAEEPSAEAAGDSSTGPILVGVAVIAALGVAGGAWFVVRHKRGAHHG